MPPEPHNGPNAFPTRPLRGNPGAGASASPRPGLPRTPLHPHRFPSIDALQHALRHPQFEVAQVQPGRLDAQMSRAVPRPDLAATLGSTSVGLRSRGLLAPDAADVVVVVEVTGSAYFNGISLRPGTVVVLPSGLEFEGHSSAASRGPTCTSAARTSCGRPAPSRGGASTCRRARSS